jgi:hypothetical protein
MKNIIATFFVIVAFFKAQFSVNVKAPSDFNASEAYLYKLNGSKDLIIDKAIKKNNAWDFNVKEKYEGMMKIFFPELILLFLLSQKIVMFLLVLP